MIKIRGFKYHDAPYLLFGFDKRAVGHGDLAAAPSQCGSIPGILQGLSTCKVTILPKFIIVDETLVHEGVPFGFRYCFPTFFIHISKTNVFHNDSFMFIIKFSILLYLVFSLCLRWRIKWVAFSDATN